MRAPITAMDKPSPQPPGRTEQQLREQWSTGLQVQAIRQMNEMIENSGIFEQSFHWVLLERTPRILFRSNAIKEPYR